MPPPPPRADTTPFLRVLSSLYVAVAQVFARETRQMSEGDKGLIFTGCANGLNPLDPLGPIFWLIDDKGALSSQKTLKRKTKQVSSWQHNRAGQQECYLFIFVVIYHRQPRRVVSGVHLKIERGENICNSTK